MTPVSPSAVSSPESTASNGSPSETVVHRLTLRGIPWRLYDQLLQVIGDGLPRMTYDRGLLEMEMPSERHEALRWLAGRFVEAYAEEFGINYRAVGSTTWRRQAVEGGVEADESYYIQNCAQVSGREVDLTFDPPPDLAIEIDLSPPDVEKASVYARLGVPEIWRWRDARLDVFMRQLNGVYAKQELSTALPGFPLRELFDALAQYPHSEPARTAAEFRRRMRINAGTS